LFAVPSTEVAECNLRVLGNPIAFDNRRDANNAAGGNLVSVTANLWAYDEGQCRLHLCNLAGFGDRPVYLVLNAFCFVKLFEVVRETLAWCGTKERRLHREAVSGPEQSGRKSDNREEK
jgi:hypothetical protein